MAYSSAKCRMASAAMADLLALSTSKNCVWQLTLSRLRKLILAYLRKFCWTEMWQVAADKPALC